MSKTISSALLAKSTFVSGINDKLIALDVYTKDNKNIVNKIQDITKAFDVDLTNILKGGDFIESNFPIIKDIKGELVNINVDNLVARVASSIPDVTGTLRSIGDGVLGKIKEYAPLQEVFTTVNGIATQVKEAAYTGLADVSKMIGEVTGNVDIFKVIDKDAVSAMYSGLIKEASALGIPDSFSAVVSSISDNKILSNVIKNILPTVIGETDVRMLQSIVGADISKITRILDTDLIGKFVKGYSFGNGFGEGEEQAQFKMAKESFDSIDELWNKKIVPEMGVEAFISDVSKITSSTTDFKEAILGYIKQEPMLEITDKLMSIGTLYKEVDVESEIAKNFPFFAKADVTTPKSPLIMT